MILVDTSVWIDHLRSGSPILAGLLEQRSVLGHPWVVGELALGQLDRHAEILALMRRLPQATLATAAEVLTLIEGHGLQGAGIRYVDAQLLAATKLTSGASLWTTDRSLAAVAARLSVAPTPTPSRRRS